jgi:hypothetical protein
MTVSIDPALCDVTEALLLAAERWVGNRPRSLLAAASIHARKSIPGPSRTHLCAAPFTPSSVRAQPELNYQSLMYALFNLAKLCVDFFGISNKFCYKSFYHILNIEWTVSFFPNALLLYLTQIYLNIR